MRLEQLAGRIGAKVYGPDAGPAVEIDQVYAGDRISDLLNAAGEHGLLISNLASAHLIRVAELMDIPGICLVSAQQPDEKMLAAAREHGTLLVVSPHSLFETCGRVYQCLAEEKRSPA
jgi:hypothetical protein